MKKIRTIVAIMFLSLVLCGMTSCEVSRHAENGRHRGWFHRHDDHREKSGAVLIIGQDNRNNWDHHNDD